MRQYVRGTKCVFMVVVILSILFSTIYMEEMAHHHCNDQGCPICLQIHAAKDLLGAVKASSIMSIAILVLPIVVVHILYRICILRRQRSLITLKVKLRN